MALALPHRRTAYVVWEITLRCNLSCDHCGSRAGDPRSDELDTAQALDLVHQLADLGVREITLIGGEAFLRPDWLRIAAEIVGRGMICNMTTGGFGISDKLARRMVDVGMSSVSVSVDGLQATHDRLRGRQGSWQWTIRSMDHLRAAGMPTNCNTQLNRLSAPELPQLYEDLRARGIGSWQVQFTTAMGRAGDNHELLLQPAELVDFYPLLGEVARRAAAAGITMRGANNIGYYGPYDALLRTDEGAPALWGGCKAGVNTLGIEADGSIKGCPSLPSDSYVGGNVRDRSLADIVAHAPELTFNEDASMEALWGFCQSCRYASLCRGGCNWTAHVLLDRRGNNPYCHHRALTQASRGLHERIEPVEAAAGTPFDNGVFALVEEERRTAWPEGDPLHFELERVQWPSAWLEAEPGLVSRLEGERDLSITIAGERDRGEEVEETRAAG